MKQKSQVLQILENACVELLPLLNHHKAKIAHGMIHNAMHLLNQVKQLYITMAERHTCKGYTNHGYRPPAITECEEFDDGTFWVTNDEYSSQVSFCPFCGTPAPIAAQVYADENDVPSPGQ